MKTIFDTNCGIFKNDVCVAVGCDYQDILKYAKKVGNKEYIKGIENAKDVIEKLLDRGNKGFSMCNEDTNYSVLIYLREWENDWEYIDVLLHELHHAVYQVASQKGFLDEMEAQAYLFERLFGEIRRELNKRAKKTIRKNQPAKKKGKATS